MKHNSIKPMHANVAIALGLVSAGVGIAWFFGAEASAREPPDPSAVVGKPFRISDSVKEYCGAGPKIMMCEQTMPLLVAMRAEPRDPKWAGPVEALIEKSMRVGGKQWVQIRALEYAVPINDLDHDVDGSGELERLMDPLVGMVVPETGSGSEKPMIVSVLVWQKRSGKAVSQ